MWPEADATSSRDVWLQQAQNLVLLGGLSALAFSPAAPGLRLALPLATLLTGMVLVSKGRFGQYVTFCLWCFVLVPWIRRVVDLQAGFGAVNTLMLAPYTAMLPVLGAVPALLRGRTVKGGTAVGLLLVSVAYGLLVATLQDQFFAGAFDMVRWAAPPCLAVFVVLNAGRVEELRRHLATMLLLAVAVTSLYGIVQYVFAPPWDTYWMVQSKMESIGSPEPFKIRVFSTLNSPGSFSNFLAFGVVVLLASRSALRWPVLLIGGAALALTLSRSAWIATMLGETVILLTGRTRERSTVAVLAVVAVLTAPLALVVPEIQPMLETRFKTFGQLSGDNSLSDRASNYSEIIAQMDRAPFGYGLGSTGSYQSYADGKQTVIIDGGPVTVLFSLGVFGGVLYLGCIGLVAFEAFRRRPSRDETLGTGLRAGGITLLALVASGLTTVGEAGVFFWTAAGCCLAASGPATLVAARRVLRRLPTGVVPG